MSFNLSNSAQKTAKSARDKAITALKQTAKDEAKELGYATREQITGIPVAEVPRPQAEQPTIDHEFNARKVALGAQDKQKMNELRAVLDRELIQANQKRLQREQEYQKRQDQLFENDNQLIDALPATMPKPRGVIGRAAQAIKSKLSSSTSKAEKQRNASG